MDLEKSNQFTPTRHAGDVSSGEGLGQPDSSLPATELESERLHPVVPPQERTKDLTGPSGLFREPVSKMGAWLAQKFQVPKEQPPPALQQPTGNEILNFQSSFNIETPPKEILSTLLEHLPVEQGYALVPAPEGWRLSATKGDVSTIPADPKQIDSLRRRVDKHQLLEAGVLPKPLQALVKVMEADQQVSLHRVGQDLEGEWMMMPLQGQGKAVGIILAKVGDQPNTSAQTSTQDTLQAISPWKAAGDMALNLFYDVVEQKKEAIIDELTSLPNLRYFNKYLPQMLNEAEQEQAPVSILAIDIDHLKEHNSRGGWDAGDAVITTVADLLKSQFRGVNDQANDLMSDSVVRVHGDEIVCILPRCHLSDAVVKGQKNVDIVRNKASEALGVPVSITIGVASSDDLDGTASDAKDKLLKLAVDQLTNAKNEHLRDQVHVQPSKAWHVIGAAYGLTEPEAMLYEQEFRTMLSRATSDHQVIKLTETEAQNILGSDSAQQLKDKLCLDNQHPEVEGKVAVPTADTLDEKIAKMNSYQDTAFNKTAPSSADRQAFGIEALALQGYTQKALQALEYCSDEERPAKADLLIQELEKSLNKENHTQRRLALIERLSKDETLSKGLGEHLKLDADELSALWQDLAKIGRFMNLGEASSTFALSASARKFTRDERMIYFKDNFTKTADLLKAFKLTDQESISIIKEIRHGNQQTPKSQLLDLVDQAAALLHKRPMRDAFPPPPDAIPSRLKTNGERYGIDPVLISLVTQAVT